MELQTIKNKIYEIRNQKVILDFDLSALYETETRTLKQALNRNMDRFPADLMLQLTKAEWLELITNCDNLPPTAKFSPSRPYTFTEQGVAMISSILKSKKAIEVNIGIMRAVVLIRQYALSHSELTEKLREIEAKFDQQFSDVYEALTFLMNKSKLETNQKQREKIGYKITS